MSQWHYKLGESEHGPVAFAELVELVRAGIVFETVPVRRAGTGTWANAWTFDVLFAAAKRPAIAAAPPDAGVPSSFEASALKAPHVSTVPGTSGAGSRGGGPTVFASWRWVFTSTISLAATLCFYRWTYWQNLAFPQRRRPGELVGAYYFVLIGDCTGLECGLLYLDLFLVVAAAAWWFSGWIEANYRS